MLFFVPDATFTQQFIMYGFFIGTPILLFILIAFVGIKSVKQNRTSKKCSHCGEFIKKSAMKCKSCGDSLEK